LTFLAGKKDSNWKTKHRDLIKVGRIHIIQHVKIRAEANPFDSVWTDYFRERKLKKRDKNQDKRFGEETLWLLE